MRKRRPNEDQFWRTKSRSSSTSWTENRNVQPPLRCTTILNLPSLVAPGGGVRGIAGVGVAAKVLLATLLALLRLASLLGGTLLELVSAELLVSTKLLLVATVEAAAAATVAIVATLLAALAVIVVATLLLHAVHAATVSSVAGRSAAVCIPV